MAGDMRERNFRLIMELRVFLNTLEKQAKFNKIVNNPFYDGYDIDVYVTPNRLIDAKSLMGLYNIDTTDWVYVYINTHKKAVLDKFDLDMKEFKKKG